MISRDVGEVTDMIIKKTKTTQRDAFDTNNSFYRLVYCFKDHFIPNIEFDAGVGTIERNNIRNTLTWYLPYPSLIGIAIISDWDHMVWMGSGSWDWGRGNYNEHPPKEGLIMVWADTDHTDYLGFIAGMML